MTGSEWKKSSFSNGSGGNNCVEVTRSAFSDDFLVRCSRFKGSWISFTRAEWEAFLAGVKAGEFDIE